MAGMKDLANVWKNLKEVDLRPIQEQALLPLTLAIVGKPGVGRHTLADALRRDPNRPESTTQTHMIISHLDSTGWVPAADLIIMLIDSTGMDFTLEQALVEKWTAMGKKVVAVFNKVDLLENRHEISSRVGWTMPHILFGSVLAEAFLQNQLVPIVLDLLPDQRLALGRQFPLFRMAVASHLIQEACHANAFYSLSTGIAEVVPLLDLPLNITDMVVLTKAQAFLVYRLGLALGFSTRWQDYLGEFGSVVGSGFVWRQTARMLVGLIPVWGIVPKVAVAYAGTYVVGHMILQWYLTGRKVPKQQMRALYLDALANGKRYAQSLASRLPRTAPRLPRPRIIRRKAAQITAHSSRDCPVCGKQNAPDANFCQYCGQVFTFSNDVGGSLQEEYRDG